MNRESIQKLRLDRRLIRRSGWISEKELETALAALPDVSDKKITLGEAEESEAASTSSEGTTSE